MINKFKHTSGYGWKCQSVTLVQTDLFDGLPRSPDDEPFSSQCHQDVDIFSELSSELLEVDPLTSYLGAGPGHFFVFCPVFWSMTFASASAVLCVYW